MSQSSLLILAFSVIMIMLFALIGLIARVRKLEGKLVDVKPQDLYPFIEEMRELVLESERVADKLESSIREKEELLEDLSDLADAKLKTFDDSFNKQDAGRSLKQKIIEMSDEGYDVTGIAKKLGISTTEVKLVQSINRKDG